MRPRWPTLILGVICVLVGATWALQGVGLLAGSPMTGRTLWLVVGTILFIIGLALAYRGITARARQI